MNTDLTNSGHTWHNEKSLSTADRPTPLRQRIKERGEYT